MHEASVCRIAIALAKVRRFEEAIAVCRTAAVIHQEAGDRRGEAFVLNYFGGALMEVRPFEEVIAVQKIVSEICRETGDRHGEATTISNLGLALAVTSRFGEAITAHEGAI